ncbi:22420_t:CDS:2 [Entrophospora sp. SA101]|nr:22420_t:CDS:2 [Entrophospora sp. SA101]
MYMYAYDIRIVSNNNKYTRTQWRWTGTSCDGLIDEKINFIEDEQQGVKRFEICDDMIYHNSHNGYVYALVLGVNKDGDILISGQIWSIKQNSMNLLRRLGGTDAGVLTLVLQDELLICGTQGGNIKIYDLETYQVKMNINSKY